MSIGEFAGLLADQSRPGAPEPTLLPWLARRIPRSELPIAAVAAAGSTSTPGTASFPGNRWPVIADSIAAIIAEREQDPGRLAGLLDILPPVAAHLGPESLATIDWAQVRGDALGYAIVSGHLPAPLDDALPSMLANTPWDAILAARPLPPLADIGALLWLATAAPDAGTWTDQEAAYLLKFRSGPQARRQTLEAIETAVGESAYWYAGALLTRAVPWLHRDDQARLREAMADMPAFWSSRLSWLADGSIGPWDRDEDELAASHPVIPRLNELAATVDPDQLAAMAGPLIERIVSSYGLDLPWEASADWLLGDTEAVDTAPRQEYGLSEGQLRSMGLAAPAKRHLNVYVAAAGQEDPVQQTPLDLGADYVLHCNIGTASDRSLVQGETSVFPEKFLPAGPLELRIVLFLNGRKAVITPLELPEQGDSDWVELPLPRVTEPSVLHGDVTVYYGAAIVLMYGLILPFGGDGAHGPEAVRRYQISRSLANLEELEGRSMSFAVSGPPTAPSIYVNDLTFAPAELRYDPREMDQGQFAIRTGFYQAHFSVKVIKDKVGEESKFSPGPDLPFAKSAAEFVHDLSMLASDGSEAFNYLFRNTDHRARVRRMLRTEAAARGRPPVVQVVPLGEQPVPIPWAALYDLPLDDIDSYEPCPSIAEFGPRGSAATVPVTCPYEEYHQDGDRWKPNQLCPWGFWGLSTIIEHPPSTQARDLETRVRPATGPPAILVGYDTGLDGKLRKDHLKKLEKVHGSNLLVPYADRVGMLKQQLGGENMDVVYLYCHVIEDPTRPDRNIPAIQFGDSRVTSQNINSWHETAWPDRHWKNRHPLVVLNGCGSAVKGPGSLASLVGAFVEIAGASGVIGTEIAIEQGLGGWAMELFLSALRDRPVGEALRSTRWEMVRGGNLIGLAYTPYCLAGLTVSPHWGG